MNYFGRGTVVKACAYTRWNKHQRGTFLVVDRVPDAALLAASELHLPGNPTRMVPTVQQQHM